MISVNDFIQGLGFNFTPIFDGNIYRFARDGGSKKNCWYVGIIVNNPIFKDPLKILHFGDWSTDENHKYMSKGRFSKDEKEIKDLELERLRKKEAEVKEALAKEQLEIAKSLLNESLLCDVHPYLSAKKIKASGEKVIGGSLLIPLYSDVEMKELCSIQYIKEDGSKKFMYGLKSSGGMCVLGYQKNPIQKEVYICEGYATGKTIKLVTAATVIVAFNAQNILPVAKKVAEHYGSSVNIIICADNDQYKDNNSNPGRDWALRAIEGIGYGEIKFPVFKDMSIKPTDFNDLFVLEGFSSVENQLYNSKLEEKYPTMENGFHTYTLSKDGDFIWEPDYEGLSNYFKNEIKYINTESWQYYYKDGFYNRTNNLELDDLIINEVIRVPEKVKPSHTLNGFSRYVRAKCIYKEHEYLSDKSKINIENGILDIKSKELIQHSPNYFFKYKIPFNYDPAATCGNWNKFLLDIFNGSQEMVDLSSEIFGYTLLGGAPFLHKAFCLIGTGRNGKSVYLNVLKAMLSKSNYSAVSMEKIGEPFHAVLMDNKLANIVGESPSKATIPSDAFKALVAGDEIMVSYKGRDNFMMTPTARLFFASNTDPVFRDNSFGLQERLIILPFNKTYLEDQIDLDLSDKLIATEIPGVMNWAIEGLERLLARGKFEKNSVSNQAKELFKKESCSVYAFYRRYFNIANNEEAGNLKGLKLSSFYPIYALYCEESGEMKKSLKAFSRDMKNYIKQDCGHEGVYESNGYFHTRRLIPNIEFDALKLSSLKGFSTKNSYIYSEN